MADERGNGDHEGPGLTFTGGLIGGVVITIVVAIVGFLTVGEELGIPVLILGGLCAAAALAYRLVGSSGPEAANDPAGSSIPQLQTEDDRPLGDSPQAHDELNPHDIPKSSPVREAAAEMAEGAEGTTRGKEEGGAAGEGGSEEDDQDAVSPGEAHGGAQTTGRD